MHRPVSETGLIVCLSRADAHRFIYIFGLHDLPHLRQVVARQTCDPEIDFPVKDAISVLAAARRLVSTNT